MFNIYAWNYRTISLILLIAVLMWRLLRRVIPKNIWNILNMAGAAVGLLLILKFTVLGRSGSGNHEFLLVAAYSNEFFREMLMNVFLYVPFGVCLGQAAGKKTILIAFALSFVIETWQFIAGTGVAQGTDLICNVLGAGLGQGIMSTLQRII